MAPCKDQLKGREENGVYSKEQSEEPATKTCTYNNNASHVTLSWLIMVDRYLAYLYLSPGRAWQGWCFGLAMALSRRGLVMLGVDSVSFRGTGNTVFIHPKLSDVTRPTL
jgi:hypothetical protein